ncbi:MAG: hypothetical protein V3S01_08110 [Dehalococcoidia bacterium]
MTLKARRAFPDYDLLLPLLPTKCPHWSHPAICADCLEAAERALDILADVAMDAELTRKATYLLARRTTTRAQFKIGYRVARETLVAVMSHDPVDAAGLRTAHPLAFKALADKWNEDATLANKRSRAGRVASLQDLPF